MILMINDRGLNADLLLIHLLKDTWLLLPPSSQQHFACMSKHAHRHKHKKQETNTLISEILHKFHHYNAHHSFCVPPC